MFSDVDLVLSQYLPITHHGMTHTILFVVVVSVLVGAVASRWLTDWLNVHSWIRSTTIARKTVFAFATAGMLVGATSHLFADLLSAPDIAAPLSPF